MKKHASVGQRRIELLQEKINHQRNASHISGGDSPDGKADVSIMKQRAYSSTGRTQAHFTQIHELEQNQAIDSGLERF